MNVTYLRTDVLVSVHERLIQTYGGIQGVRDSNALESAVTRPKQLNNYTGEARIGALAACLSWAILRNHPFTDGNKRLALAAFVMFVQLNHHRLSCSESEETAMILKAASSSISEEKWIAWAMQVVVPG